MRMIYIRGAINKIALFCLIIGVAVVLLVIINMMQLAGVKDKLYLRPDCTVQVLIQKGALYEKMKSECKVLHVLDANGNEVETITN